MRFGKFINLLCRTAATVALYLFTSAMLFFTASALGGMLMLMCLGVCSLIGYAVGYPLIAWIVLSAFIWLVMEINVAVRLHKINEEVREITGRSRDR